MIALVIEGRQIYTLVDYGTNGLIDFCEMANGDTMTVNELIRDGGTLFILCSNQYWQCSQY